MPDSSSALPSLASIWQLLELHRPALAETAARQRLATDPTDWQTLLALTEALQQQQRLAEAFITASAAIQAEANAHEAHFALAQVLGSQGQLHQAEIAVQQALRLNPREARYHGFRSQLLYLLHYYKTAISCAEEGLQLAPEHADCLLWRALAQESLDQPAAADEDFERLLRVAPESELVHARLGRMLLNRYQPAAADNHLTEALRQNPGRAAELGPLLRQARERRLWPEWLLRSEQRADERRALGLDPGLGVLLNRMRGVGHVARGWWRIRRDPLFEPLRAQARRRRLGCLYALMLFVPLVIFVSFGLFYADTPFTLLRLVGIVAGSGVFFLIAFLIKRQIPSEPQL